ncbi:autotransporter [Paraburkholderia sp. 22099]|uniref:autotransporter n=1 Tax=Paraburkholderia TaxID=1822464 RepID=UPI0028549D33|nr:autotransporter [Paraburkholderia terricola]MDR6494339.1 hypothetical protein [Paraburkholderia terricola]
MSRHRRIDVSPVPHLSEAAADAPAPVTAETVKPTPRGWSGWLRAALPRPARMTGARRVEFSTALFQHSTHGRSSGPEHHADGDSRFPPAGKSRHARRETSPFAAAAHVTAPATVSPSASSETCGQPADPPAREAAASWRATPLDAIVSRDDLTAYVQQQFTDGAPDPAGEAHALAARLHDLCRSKTSPAEHAAAAVLSGRHARPPEATDGGYPDALAASRGALLAQALKLAGVTDLRAAPIALQRIGMLDFTAPRRRRSDGPAECEAWRAARLLARSGVGREVLDALRAATPQTPPTHHDELHRFGVEALLTSCEALDPARHADPHARPDGAPGAVAARAGLVANPPLTADEPGVTALAKRAFDAAATLLEHGRDALTPDQKGALFAWRQAFTEDGRHTDLSQARQRLGRFAGKTIARVGEKRWKTLLPRMFRGKHGSPLSALRFGTQGVPRKTIAQERAKLRDTLQAALAQLKRNPAMDPRAALAHARPEASLAELAALHVWLERGGFPPGRLSDATLRAIAERAHQMADEATRLPDPTASPPSPAAGVKVPRRIRARVRATTAHWLEMTPQELARTKPFRTIAKRPFTVERLAVWGKVAHVPHDAPFWNTVDELRALVQHDGASRPADNVDDVRETLLDVVSNLQSGQRLRLTDGGRQGLSTRGLNVTVETLLKGHAVPVSPRVDLRASRTREAVVEVSRSTHCVSLFVGTSKSSMHHVGAGLLVGYDVETALTTVRAGLVTNVILHARELSEPRGVSLRVARRLRPDGTGYDDDAMRAKLAALVGHLFDEAAGAHDDGPAGVWNRLAQRYWDDPDVSLSWTDGHASNRRRGATLDVNATVKVASLGGEAARDPHTGKSVRHLSARAGPSAGGGWERSRQKADIVERSGRVRIDEHRVGLGSQWQVRGAIAPGFSHPVGADGRRSVGLFSIDAPAATMTLRERNRSAKRLLVREDGRLSHRGCILDVEYLDARTYTRAVDEARAELVALFAAPIIARRRKEGPPSRGRHARPEPAPEVLAAQRIDTHLAAVRRNQRANLTYVRRYRLRRHAALRLDANTATLEQSGDDPQLKERIDAANARILDDPASWMPIELKVKERNANARSFGPNVVLQLTTRMGAVGDREIVTEGVPFSVLEALDR